jgi:flagellar basal-body rod protein FlgG
MRNTPSVTHIGLMIVAVLGMLLGQFALQSYFENRRLVQSDSVPSGNDLPVDWDHDLKTGENNLPGSFQLNLDDSMVEPAATAINVDGTAEAVDRPASLDSSSTPAKLPQPENASPITDHLKNQESLIRSIIKQELPSATAQEQEIWLDRLRGMAFQDIRFLLRMRKQDVLELRQKIDQFGPQQQSNSTASNLNPSVTLPHSEKPQQPHPLNGVTSDIQQLILRRQSLELVQGSIKTTQEAQNVILNNIANANTTGFKRSEVLFEDLGYRHVNIPGAQDENGKLTPVGIAVGMGSRISGTRLDYRQGQLMKTGGKFDLAIEGDGFFQIQDGAEILYTRSGKFGLNSDGEIVMASADKGRLLEPSITIPQGTLKVTISGNGTVAALVPPRSTLTDLGQIETVTFVNPEGLLQRGNNLYSLTDASGTPMQGVPGIEGRGILKQGFLESSNVDLVHELIEWKKLQNQLQVLSHIAGLPVIDGISVEILSDLRIASPSIVPPVKSPSTSQ